jgi:hypothetical protein
MKKLVAILLLLAPFQSAHSAVLTVSQSVNIPAQYTDINTAIVAASPGDTIYIHPTPGWYNYIINVGKRLVLIASGHHPSTASGQIVHVNGINLYNGCSGSAFYGISTGIVQKLAGSNNDTLNLTWKECRFTAMLYINTYGYSNYVIENCLFDGGNIGFYNGGTGPRSGMAIRNCIFGTYGASGGASISDPPDNTVIDHNVFIGTATNIRAITNGVNCTISNNVFFARTIDTTGGYNMGTGCVMLNNITWLCTNTLPTAGNSGSGNLNADPQFLNFSSVAANFSYAYNFRLGPASPGHNAATDGTDIGLYGNGIVFSTTGEPEDVPVIRKLDIYNSTVPLNGTLDIRMRSTVPVRN